MCGFARYSKMIIEKSIFCRYEDQKLRNIFYHLHCRINVLLLMTIHQLREIQADIAEKGPRRFNSLRLAMELFQSSEDLTRMARTYVITDNPVCKDYFSRILAIHNGQLSQPSDYSLTYWHLEGIGKSPVAAPGEAIALRDFALNLSCGESDINEKA